MKISINKMQLSMVSLFLSSFVGVAFAAPISDLQSNISGPSFSPISTSVSYSAGVKNIGPATAEGVKLKITFPLTNTSPQVYVLGNIASLDPRCQINLNEIVCNIGQLKKGKSANISYSYKAPVSTKILSMKNTVSSLTSDNALQNNEAIFTPNFTYPDRPISRATTTNSHCTGQNLTSYFECQLFPSSISSHGIALNTDHSITINEIGYTGVWSQVNNQQLKLEYFENSIPKATFNGFAVNGANCFDGLTIFASSTYVSPYHVCVE